MSKELSTPTLLGIGIFCLAAFVFASDGDYKEAKRQEAEREQFRKWYKENCITKTMGYIASAEPTATGRVRCTIYKRPGPADIERRVVGQSELTLPE